MNLFELFVKIGVDDQASGKLKDLGDKLGNGLKTAAKIGTAAVGAAAAGITALTTAAVNNYAEYEQLVGGAQLMFGKAYDTVAKNAQDAYKTVQMSQNEYLQQVNGFATGLKTALGGNEQAAAELADRIITAEADIIAATGNTAENVQNAFNGIMKSNFTMLDNLQIGITPTKEGFQEVIDKVNEWNKANGEATNYQMGNLADMQSALVDYIEMQGYAGYASREAANTISGSVASMKSAWTNLVTGLADGNADIGQLVDNLVTTIVGDGTENNLGVIGNILPAVETALDGSGKLIDKVLPIVIEKIPAFIEKYLPKILQSGVNIIRSILSGISSNPDKIVSTIMSVVNTLTDAIIDMLPEIIVTGSLLLGKLAVGIIQAIPELVAKIPQVIKSVVNGFKSNSGEFSSIGRNIVNGVWSGIQSMLSTFTRNVKNFFSGIVNSVKKTLGIRSPSRVFAEIGGFMAKGLDKGWEDEFGNVKKDIDNSLSFDDAYMGIGASVSNVGSGMSYGGTSIGNITINIDGAKYSNEQSIASAIALEIQNMTDRRAAVYA